MLNRIPFKLQGTEMWCLFCWNDMHCSLNICGGRIWRVLSNLFYILKQGHLKLWVWFGAKPFTTFLCCIGPGVLEIVKVLQPGRRRWLGIYWCKAICSSEFDESSHLQPLVVMLCWARYLEVVSVWQPARWGWLGISWCKAICSAEFDMVPSHLQLFVVMLY